MEGMLVEQAAERRCNVEEVNKIPWSDLETSYSMVVEEAQREQITRRSRNISNLIMKLSDYIVSICNMDIVFQKREYSNLCQNRLIPLSFYDQFESLIIIRVKVSKTTVVCY